MKRTVKNQVTLPGGQPIARRKMTFKLFGPAFLDGGTREVLSTEERFTDATGLWSLDLDVNPDGTYYTVKEVQGVIHTFVVPEGSGVLWLHDVLVPDPSLPPVTPGPSTAYVDEGDAATLTAANAYTDTHAGSGGLPAVIDLGGPNNTTGA